LITATTIQKTKAVSIENQAAIFFGAAYNIGNLCVERNNCCRYVVVDIRRAGSA
jgi:hypothetical protein